MASFSREDSSRTVHVEDIERPGETIYPPRGSYPPYAPQFFPDVTVEETVELLNREYGHGTGKKRAKVDHMLTLLDIDPRKESWKKKFP